jgi:hypothetical protein
MGYLRQKNSEIIVCDLNTTPIVGDMQTLQQTDAYLSGNFDFIDEELPSEISKKLVYMVDNA